MSRSVRGRRGRRPPRTRRRRDGRRRDGPPPDRRTCTAQAASRRRRRPSRSRSRTWRGGRRAGDPRSRPRRRLRPEARSPGSCAGLRPTAGPRRRASGPEPSLRRAEGGAASTGRSSGRANGLAELLLPPLRLALLLLRPGTRGLIRVRDHLGEPLVELGIRLGLLRARAPAPPARSPPRGGPRRPRSARSAACSSGRAVETMRPSASWRYASQASSVPSRWAIMNVVRPAHQPLHRLHDHRLGLARRPSSSARRGCRIGASLRNARASEMRWRSPPESVIPRSPTIVS